MLTLNKKIHVFNEIKKLNGVEFHGNKLILEQAKTLPWTIYSNNTLLKSSDLLEPLPNLPLSKPANPTRSNTDQALIKNFKYLYSDAIMSNKEYIHCVKSVQIRSFFLVRIFLCLDWIQQSMDQKKLRIWTHFSQWSFCLLTAYREEWKWQI